MERSGRALPNATTHEFLIGFFAVIRRSPRMWRVTGDQGRVSLTENTENETDVCSPTFKMTKSIVCPALSVAPSLGERPAALTNTR